MFREEEAGSRVRDAPGEGLAMKVAALDARCRSNTHRIDELESDQKAVMELALSVKAMATEQSNMKEDLGEVKADVKTLTSKSGRNWDSLVEKSVWLLIGGLLAFALAQLGIG